MTLPSFEAFAAPWRAAGYDEAIERDWAPGTVLATHTHPFDVQVLVTRGELWLGYRGTVRHLRAGDRFALDRDEPHDERYGAEGATYWVARRHTKPADPPA